MYILRKWFTPSRLYRVQAKITLQAAVNFLSISPACVTQTVKTNPTWEQQRQKAKVHNKNWSGSRKGRVSIPVRGPSFLVPRLHNPRVMLLSEAFKLIIEGPRTTVEGTVRYINARRFWRKPLKKIVHAGADGVRCRAPPGGCSRFPTGEDVVGLTWCRDGEKSEDEITQTSREKNRNFLSK